MNDLNARDVLKVIVNIAQSIRHRGLMLNERYLHHYFSHQLQDDRSKGSGRGRHRRGHGRSTAARDALHSGLRGRTGRIGKQEIEATNDANSHYHIQNRPFD